MLIKHISIPRNSSPITFKTHKEPQESYQLRDYSDYLTRTLNPQQPDNDVLVSFKPKSQNKISINMENGKKAIRRSSSVLDSETPQTISEFTNVNLPNQPELRDQNQMKQRQIRSNYSILKRQKIANWRQNRQLNNTAYLENLYKKRDYSLTPIVNKAYLKQHQIIMDEEDNGLVNNHAKSSIVNGQLYRTLEKIQARNVKEKQTIYDYKTLKNKKYHYSLPKNDSNPINVQNFDQKRLAQKKEKVQQRLTIKSINEHKNINGLFTDNPLPERKKKIMPFQKEQSNFAQMVTFDIKKQKEHRVRKTSQEQSIIVFKPASEMNFSNKQTKIKPSKLTDYVDVPPKIQISYRTPLSELKQICSMKQLDKSTVVIKIPEIFSYPMFTGLQEQSSLFRKAQELFSLLEISYKKDMSIKRYNNCLLIVANYIAIVWHYAGKVYLGGWKYEMLDEGHKNGLGIQWSPKKYVYYGEFANGKRHGVGIMKCSSNEILTGIWHENKYIRLLKKSDLNSHNIYALFQAEQANP